MQNQVLYSMVFIVAITQFAWSQDAPSAAPAQDAVQPTSEARALFDTGGHVDHVMYQVLNSEVFRQEVLHKAAGLDEKSSPEELPQIGITWLNPGWGAGSGVFEYVVSSYDSAVPAEKVLEVLKEVLTAKLDRLDLSYKRKMEQLAAEKKRLDMLQATVQREGHALLLLAKDQHVELNPAVATERRVRLETELQSVQVEKRGLEARRKIIEQQIAALGKQIEEGAGTDPAILKELSKSVEARRKVVEYWQAQFKVANASVEDMEKAKDQLAQAEAELARYRRSAANEAGGQRLAELRHRLEDTAIELAEVEARQIALLELAADARNQSPQVETKKIEVELLEQEFRRARERLDKLELEVQQHVPPSVTLILLESKPQGQ